MAILLNLLLNLCETANCMTIVRGGCLCLVGYLGRTQLICLSVPSKSVAFELPRIMCTWNLFKT